MSRRGREGARPATNSCWRGWDRLVQVEGIVKAGKHL